MTSSTKHDPRISLAKSELVQRELAKKSLIAYAERFIPEYSAGWAHKLIAANLEKFYEQIKNRESPRLMLFLPPRFGKSKLASQLFPSWVLGHDPSFEFIVAAYATSLPMDFSRYIKGLLDDPAYQVLFPDTKLDPKAQATDGWYTTKNGCYFPAGVGSGITGRGCQCLIVDDPVKDAEQADSETVLDKAWDWYGSTAMTRVAPGGGILCIQTRWSDLDLSGRLLQAQEEQEKALLKELEVAKNTEYREFLESELKKIEKWDVISFPAIAEHDEYITPDLHLSFSPQPGYIKVRSKGDAVHPARYDEAALNRIKNALAPRHWNSLYQQNPVPEEGSFFQKSYIRHTDVRRMPEFPVIQTWDFAIGLKNTNDWTVGVTGFLDYTGVLHVVDIVRFRGGTFDIVSTMCDQIQKHRPSLVGMEKGHISMAVMPLLEEELKTRRLHPSIDAELKPVQDKVLRARPLQGMFQRGMISINDKYPWMQDLISELLRFPHGTFDDQVDALSMLAKLALDTPLPQQPRRKKLKSWKDKVNTYIKTQQTNPGGFLGA